MAKLGINQYDTTAANNADIGGISILGTAAPSNFDNALREFMTQLALTANGTYSVFDTWSFCDPADQTRILRFDAGGIGTGQTRVFALPNYDGTLATLAGTETLTNKTLASPNITGLAASTTASGIIELATNAEATAGTDTARAVTPAGAAAAIAAKAYDGEIVSAWTWSALTTAVDFYDLSAYQRVRVIIDGITLGSSDRLAIRVSIDNGATFISAGYASQASNDGTGTTSTAAFVLMDTAGTSIVNGVIDINLLNTNTKAALSGIVNNIDKVIGLGPSGINNSIRITTIGGANITGGSMKLLGWRSH